MVGRGAGDGAEVGRGGDWNHCHGNYLMNHDCRHDDQNLYECMMGGSSQDGLEPLNPVDSVEGGVRQDLVHHLVIIVIII